MKDLGYGKKGSGHGKCPRCGKGSDTHEIASCDITDGTVAGVKAILASTKAARGAADHMVGAAIARTDTGLEIKLIAVSGGGDMPGTVSGWQAANVKVPKTSAGWTDIYGETFSLPADLVARQPQVVNRACAAIKLLIKLGERRRAARVNYRYKSITLYEEAVPVVETVTLPSGREKEAKSRINRWRGESGEFIYAAHSCEECESRIPLMLCSNPSID